MKHGFLKKIGLLLVLLLLPSFAFAAPKVEASLSENVIAIDEEAVIKITISDTTSFSEPEPPQVSGLNIVQSSQYTGVNFSFGQSSIVSSYEFTIIPTSKGNFTIPPFTVQASGQTFKTQSFELKVEDKNYYAKPQNQNSPYPSFGQPQKIPQQKREKGEPFWVETTVTKINPMLYEQIFFHFKLFTRVNLDFQGLQLPEFDDFRVEKLVSEKQGQELVDGERYTTYEILYVLFPLKTGVLEVAPTELKISYFKSTKDANTRYDPFLNDPFFNPNLKKVTQLLKTDALTIHVRPLPEPIPSGFTNLVGQFEAEFSLEENQIKNGEPTTLEIKISGEGNINDAVLPDLKLPQLKIYPETPKTDYKKSLKGLSGTKTFVFTLIPTKTGKILFSDLALSYFDPEAEKYQTLVPPKLELTILENPDLKDPNKLNLAQTEEKTEIKVQGLATLMTDATLAERGSRLKLPKIIFYGISFGLPAVFFSIGFLFLFPKGEKKVSQKFVYKRAYQSFIHSLHQRHKTEAQVLESVRGYFSAISGMPRKSQTAVDIEKFCVMQGVAQELIDSLKVNYEKLEASQYGFASEEITEGSWGDLKKILVRVHEQLLKHL